MDLFKLLGAVAPTLGKAISGDVGGAVGEALKAFGIDSGSKDDLEKVMKNATPEQMAELRKIDTAYQQKLAELNVDLEKIMADDRNSARQMYASTKDRLVPILACIFVLGAFGMTAALLRVSIPEMNRDIVMMAYGTIMSLAGAVANFYFGSSKSSSEKNKIISEMTK